VLYTLAVALTRGSRAQRRGCVRLHAWDRAADDRTMPGLPPSCTPARWPSRAENGAAWSICSIWPGRPHARARRAGGRYRDQAALARAGDRNAILINILNRNWSIFFLAFLPQFIAVDEPHPLARMAELSGVIHGDDLLRCSPVYGLFAASGAIASSPGRR